MTTTTQTYPTAYASEILRQLGGNRFIAMTGAKNFTRNDTTQTICFHIGKNCHSINYVRITLNSMDTYDVEFITLRAGVTKVRATDEGIYNDQLQDVFTSRTGMYTRL